MPQLNFRYRRPFLGEFDVERIPEIPNGSVLPRVGEGGGPILHVRPHNGSGFILVLPDLDRMAPHVMTWPNPRMMLVSLGPKKWLIDIDRPALDEISLPGGLVGMRPFVVPKLALYIMFNGSRVMAYDVNGVRFDFHYDCNVTNVELQGDNLVITWWPNAQGKWIDQIDVISGKKILREPDLTGTK